MVNNRNYSRQTAKKLQPERKILYTPEAKSDWGYAHHTQMMAFGGKLYIMWSLGRTHEDMFGQKVMYAYTENGTDWSEPAPLVDTMMGASKRRYYEVNTSTSASRKGCTCSFVE